MHWASTEILTFAVFSCLLLLVKRSSKINAMQECEDGEL